MALLTGSVLPRTGSARDGSPHATGLPVAEAISPSTAPAHQPVSTGSFTTSPVVHIIEKRPDEERGVVKLARHINSTSQRSGDIVHVTVNYKEQCTLPCGVPVDNSERPIFFLIRDGSPVSQGFRVPPGADEFTIRYDVGRRGLAITGAVLTYAGLFPIGIPIWIAGKSRMWIAAGDPKSATDFVRLKKAKT